MIHEGIHAILTNLGAAHVHWFQEGGNTWLQQEMMRRSGASEYSGMGFLNAGDIMAPFVPIENYSGWLLDGSFGGPGAEGVDAGGKKCNWRNMLGGVQYGNLFPTFLGLWVAEGAVPWIWVNGFPTITARIHPRIDGCRRRREIRFVTSSWNTARSSRCSMKNGSGRNAHASESERRQFHRLRIYALRRG